MVRLVTLSSPLWRHCNVGIVTGWDWDKIAAILQTTTSLTHLPWTKWPPFRRRHVQTHFLEWKYFNFKQYFIEICSLGSNWQYVSIGSDNGLAPSRRQAIIWTNVDPIHRRIYAALGGDELTAFSYDEIVSSWFKRHWNLPRSVLFSINQHWFRLCLDVEQCTNTYELLCMNEMKNKFLYMNPFDAIIAGC